MTEIQSRGPSFDALLLQVGKLNYTWTNTESLFIHLIAGLAGTDKETATVVFLTLNTTRARVDLVERLSKLDRVDDAERTAILALTRDMMKLAGLRNRYNHCIYAFDPDSGSAHTILMRIADRKNSIKMGQVDAIDGAAMDDIHGSIEALTRLNRSIWSVIQRFRYPV